MSVMTDSHSAASGSVKKMIRDTTRLLSRPNLPADLRREQERKLAALQVALTDRKKAEVEREMATKYRMVKFFERKKALRRLAAAQAANSAAAVAEAQLDLAYILHFPKDRKYISLYQTANSAEALTEREAIRKQISEKLALLGAESMLAQTKKMKNVLKASDEDSDEDVSEEDDDEEEDSEDDEEDSDDVSDEEDSDSDDDDDDEDSEDEDDEEDGLSYDEDEDSDDVDSEDDDDLDSEDDEDSEDDDSEDSDDEDSEDDEEDSEEEEEDSEEEESEDEDDEDAPKPKKGRH